MSPATVTLIGANYHSIPRDLNMKVIILAGGWGTRMGQHTEWVPKPMVYIGDKPMIWHVMKIYSHYGYRDFIVSAGVKSHIIKEYFLNFEAYSNDFTRDFSTGKLKFHTNDTEIDWKVSIVDTGLDTLKGARIKRLEQYLTEDNNMVTYGDGLGDLDISRLVDFHESHKKLVTITGVRPQARYGELLESSGVVTAFSEKPRISTGLVNGGFMVFRRGFLDYLTEKEDCDLEFGVLEELADKGEVMVYRHSGLWDSVDHDRDLARVTQLWNSSNAFWKIW